MSVVASKYCSGVVATIVATNSGTTVVIAVITGINTTVAAYGRERLVATRPLHIGSRAYDHYQLLQSIAYRCVRSRFP